MRSRPLKQTLLLVAASVALLVPSFFGRPVDTVSAQDCTIHPVFSTLLAMLPQVVGECAQDAQVVMVTGDVMQQTTGGLLVFRHEDNWTGFTDGTTTWVLGPRGVQSRSNDTRFSWESDAGAAGAIVADDAAERDLMAQRDLSAQAAAPAASIEGVVSAARVPGSAQVVAFSFSADVNRPGNFKVEATFSVTDNGSIAYTDGLVTASEQGEFAAQPFDPAPVVNGRRSTLHWPLDVAFTPMAVSGRAFATVYVQCLASGPVAGTVSLRVVQEGNSQPLTFAGTAVSQCDSMPLFVPTEPPTPTPRPTSTPTPTFTPTETPTLSPEQFTATAVAQATESEQQVRATATEEAKATATAEEEQAQAIDLSASIGCQELGGRRDRRLITVSISLEQGGDGVGDATIQGIITKPDGTEVPFTVATDSNGSASFSILTRDEPGRYSVEITDVDSGDNDNGNDNNGNGNANGNDNNINLNFNDNNGNDNGNGNGNGNDNNGNSNANDNIDREDSVTC